MPKINGFPGLVDGGPSLAILTASVFEIVWKNRLAAVMSRVDCNAVLTSLPAATVEPLVRVQKAAASSGLQLGPRDECVTAAALAVHQSKLCVLMYAVHSDSGNSPAYISDIVRRRSASHRPGLRSADSNDYVKPRLNTKFGDRSFAYDGPIAWNQLPLLPTRRAPHNDTKIKRSVEHSLLRTT